MRKMTCPLCGSQSPSLDQTLEVSKIVDEWMRQANIDVSGEFHGILQIELLRCSNCTLQFFQPDSVAGSPALYERLGKLEWYYMQNKWEHDVAMEDLTECENGIEVGCAFGDFVARVAKERGIQFEGCEQNPHAVQTARRKGLSVHLEGLENLSSLRPSAYDAVCAFQVLEHVTRPGEFLSAACAILRPGGKLILGLPNAKSFLKHQFNFLDLPPHHMSRWTDETLTRLQQWFPLKIARIVYEPLADYHVHAYVETYTSLFASRGLHALTMPRFRSVIARFIQTSRLQRVLRGQTIYASYVRV
jgi:2-polyprenyl-3-methyl-5-hydroxy-6-metoxy-1,4-benzoquinol methylase